MITYHELHVGCVRRTDRERNWHLNEYVDFYSREQLLLGVSHLTTMLSIAMIGHKRHNRTNFGMEPMVVN